MCKLFLDSADITWIESYSAWSCFNGVTTTPSFFKQQDIENWENLIEQIVEYGYKEVHVEALGRNAEEIVEAAKYNAELGDAVVSKIPISEEALKAVGILKKMGIRTNVHLVYSVNQAFLAAKAGAEYVCPLVGRIDDIGNDGIAQLEQIVEALKKIHDMPVKIMASSLRTPEVVRRALLSGADALTIAPSVICKMVTHPLTDRGTETFWRDAGVSSESAYSVER